MTFVSQISPEITYVYREQLNSDKSPSETRVSHLAQESLEQEEIIHPLKNSIVIPEAEEEIIHPIKSSISRSISESIAYIQRDINRRVKFQGE